VYLQDTKYCTSRSVNLSVTPGTEIPAFGAVAAASEVASFVPAGYEIVLFSVASFF
jgi:hypothetical protein